MAATTAVADSAPIADSEHQSGFVVAGHTLESLVGLGLLGLLSGVTGGMVTMGGGIILVSGMFIFFGYGMMLIRPVAFVTNVFTYGAASIKNQAAGLIMWPKVKQLTPWAVAGVLLGLLLGTELDDTVIGYLLGIFALLIAAKTLHEVTQRDDEELETVIANSAAPSKRGDHSALEDALHRSAPAAGELSPTVKNGLLGLPMGLVSGLLGISGGVIEVPLQRYYARIALHNAIANSAVMVFWASLTAAVVSLIYGNKIGAFEWETPFTIALIMIPTSYLGGMLGARLLSHISPDKLKWLFAGLMFVVGIKMLFAQ